MNKHIDQSEISRKIAQKKGVDQAVVNIFIKELFKGIENKIKENTSIKVEGLGLFRVIRSGNNRRILFLGNVTNLTDQPETTKPATTVKPLLVDQPQLFIEPQDGTVFAPLEKEPSVAPIQDNTAQTVADKRSVQTDALRNRLRELENRPLYSNENRPKQAPQQKSKKPIYFGLALLVLLIVGTFAYKLMSPSPDQHEYADEALSKNRVSHFAEVVNNYPNLYSCVILVDQSISLKELSKLYYGNELFWPYIYEANKNVTQANLSVEKDNLVKIPRVIVDLAKYSSGMLEAQLREKGEIVEKKMRETDK